MTPAEDGPPGPVEQAPPDDYRKVVPGSRNREGRPVVRLCDEQVSLTVGE
ncbi:MAG TPA: hypothetical protein VMK83_04970 [Gaiellaceae bacterium]|nr:hypothetical protein [Gaiellaceae bacterium]